MLNAVIVNNITKKFLFVIVHYVYKKFNKKVFLVQYY
jgi:hypothetical protein